jgi:hypothetical protein
MLYKRNVNWIILDMFLDSKYINGWFEQICDILVLTKDKCENINFMKAYGER